MIKYLKLCLVIVFLLVLLCGCGQKRGLILFNSQPITKENALQDRRNFTVGQRIYYLFIAPEKINEEFIRVQVFKMTDKAPIGDIDVIRTKDYRLMKDERYYHTNYFVLHEGGRYVMQVFSHNDFVRPIAVNDFFVQ